MESEGNKQDAKYISFFLFDNISCIKMVWKARFVGDILNFNLFLTLGTYLTKRKAVYQI